MNKQQTGTNTAETIDPLDDLTDELVGLGATKEPEGLTSSEKVTWARQTAFLVAYARLGTVRKAAAAAQVSRSVVRLWEADDKMGFIGRKELAEHSFRELLVDTAWERVRNPQGSRGSDLLLITMMNAHWPERFRANQQPTDNTAVDLMAKLHEQAQADAKAAKEKAEQAPDFDAEQWEQRLAP